MPRRTAPFLAAVLTLAGCGSSTYADLSGTVDGNKFTASTFFWGGPFLIFTSNQQECIDFAWVKRGPTFENGGEAPNTGDMSALLFTFEGSDVTPTNTSLEGDSPIDARLLVVQDDALTVHRGVQGALIIDSVEGQDNAIGSLAVGFDEGSIEGEFEVEHCTNLVAPY